MNQFLFQRAKMKRLWDRKGVFHVGPLNYDEIRQKYNFPLNIIVLFHLRFAAFTLISLYLTIVIRKCKIRLSKGK